MLLHIKARRIRRIRIAAFKYIVCVVAWHHPAATHLIVHMIANIFWLSLIRTGVAYTETDFFVTDIIHPFLIEHILTGHI